MNQEELGLFQQNRSFKNVYKRISIYKAMSRKNSASAYNIQNIVATTSLEKPVPLVKLARTQPNTEYNPKTFPGLVLRVKEPKSAVLVFSSGNLVCTGTKNRQQLEDSMAQLLKNVKAALKNYKG